MITRNQFEAIRKLENEKIEVFDEIYTRVFEILHSRIDRALTEEELEDRRSEIDYIVDMLVDPTNSLPDMTYEDFENFML